MNRFNLFYPKLAFFTICVVYGSLAAIMLVTFISNQISPDLHYPILSSIFLFLFLPAASAWPYFQNPISKAIDSVYCYKSQIELKKLIQPLLKDLDSNTEVGVYQSDEINAFAVSTIWGSESLIAFSSALVDQLTKNQFMAIAAHEISHLKSNDSRNKTLICAFHQILNFYPWLASVFAKEFLRKSFLIVIFLLSLTVLLIAIFTSDAKALIITTHVLFNLLLKPALVVFAAITLPYLLSRLTDALFYAYSRQREYAADKSGADMTSVADMAQALEQLSNGTPTAKTEFFDTHPPISARLQHLHKEPL
jgi:Zn-dependent protease with chaperone function